VLLRQEMDRGIEVLSVQGPVGPREATTLVCAVERAITREPRGIIVDLREVTELEDSARQRISVLSTLPSGWPRAALVVCPPAAVPEMPGMLTAPDRAAALEQVDARASRPRARIEVPHDISGPAQARAAVAEAASRLGIDDLRDDVVLVVSEMVTNAVRHAQPPVGLEIEATEHDVVIAVRDGSPRRPVPRSADEQAEGGRGMMLVDLLTSEHGVRPQPPGKTVWARVRRATPAGS
jgi:anti-sigma regulatory factor (Ser/Thr protein kinase)